MMDVASLRKRLFVAVLVGFGSAYLTSPHLRFLQSMGVSAVVAAMVFLLIYSGALAQRVKGATVALLSVASLPLFLYLFGAAHNGLDEPSHVLVPYPVRLVASLVMPYLTLWVGSRVVGAQEGAAEEGASTDS